VSDQIHGNGIILPNKPWAAVRRSGDRPALVRAGEFATVAIAMVALFLFGRTLSADGAIHVTALTVGLIGSVGAFMFPPVIERFARPTPALTERRATPYSETALLKSWPVRGNGVLEQGSTRIDRPDIEA
jgi:hypothetical protein